ncbi:MAG TPA: ABC transporter ATP-binding protein [Tepidisphaeraceae bacterium]|nr:ABC transporter ATP-binding protein [Tepidisphaeraceae bacterium]
MRFYLRAIAYFRNDLPQVAWSLVLIFLASLVALLQPFPLAVLIDSVFVERPSNAWQHRLLLSMVPDSKVGQIAGLAVIALVLTVLGGLLGSLQTMASVTVGYRGLVRVRCDLFRKIQELGLGYNRGQSQGDTIYRLTNDAYGFQAILNIVLGNILVAGVMLVVMCWIMFSMNWRLTLIALAIVPLLAWAHRTSQRVLEAGWGRAKAADMGVTQAIQRSLASIWLMLAFGREPDEYKRFHAAADGAAKTMLGVHWREVWYGLAVATVLGIGTSLILGYGGYVVYQDQFVRKLGEGGMTVGKLYVFVAYLQKLYEPLNKLTGSGAAMAQGAAGARRVFEVLDVEPPVRDAPDAIALPRQPRRLTLTDVEFAYAPGGRPVLDGVSCSIEPGQMVGFVGQSGVGKSTLLNLLPRFYDPTGGSIALDGHDLRAVKVRDVRSHVALVLQDSVLLPTTVAENIAYGRPDATPQQIRAAAELAGATAFIEQMPNRFDEQVSEAGSNLSGGQRQRIGIARALLTEAPIIILDEPTSALDPEHEAKIVETLRRLKGKRTIVLVSHRLSTVADCDCIFVMDAGKIVEQGTHDELLARRGVYHRMARHQLQLDDDTAVEADTKSPARL